MKINSMTKKSIKTIALTCLFSCAFIANANAKEKLINKSRDHNYVKLKAGIVQPGDLGGNSSLNTGDSTFLGGIAVGRKVKDQFAVELEYTHRGENTAKYSSAASSNAASTSSSWDAKSDTLMLNFTADLTKDYKIRPYLKAGVGYSRNKSSDYITNDNNGAVTTKTSYNGKTYNDFSYQGGAGISMVINPTFNMDFEYLYVNRGKIKTESDKNVSTDGAAPKPRPSTARSGTLKEHTFTIGVRMKF